MRAAVLTRRSWIEILEQKIPPTNGDEVRVRIKAGGICGSDIHYFQPVSYTHLTLPTNREV